MKGKVIINLLLLFLISMPVLATSKVNAEEISDEVAEAFMQAEGDATLFSSNVVNGSKDGYNFRGTLNVSNIIFTKPKASATTESLSAPLHEIVAQVKVFKNNVERGQQSCRLKNTTKCTTAQVVAPSSSKDGLRFWGYHAVVDANLSSTWTGFTRHIY